MRSTLAAFAVLASTLLASGLFTVAGLSPLFAAGSPAVAERSVRVQGTFHFTDVTLRDGRAVYPKAEVFVRVKKSAGGGYTRADYLDGQGARLGFYEAFEVVSLEEAALREWAIKNFPDRTPAAR